jgi:hypothetical protein
MAIRSATNVGVWQQIYWREGPEAASNYCNTIVENIDKTISNIQSINKKFVGKPETLKSLEHITICYLTKQSHYLEDKWIGNEPWSRGRNEPGRCPFSYPDFRHRYSSLESLFSFLDQMIQFHQEMCDRIQTLLDSLPQDSPEWKSLLETQQGHKCSLEKWTGRKKEAEQKPQAFMLPQEKGDPLEMMHIHWAHSQGYFGKGASAIVYGEEVDSSHKALEGALEGLTNALGLDSIRRRQMEEHGTHVCGTIAAQRNGENGHTGAAPKAKIVVAPGLEGLDQVARSPVGIVNYSGTMRIALWDIISDKGALCLHISQIMMEDFESGNYLMGILKNPDPLEAERQFLEVCQMAQVKQNEMMSSLFKGKLLITSNGNDGVILDRSPKYMRQESYCHEDPLRKAQSIRVVNLLSSGMIPSPSSTLPGDEFAEMTVCAIGTDVFSTLPGNAYGRLSGTSMAAPFVTSVALLLKGAFPALKPEQVRSCILEGATPIILDENKVPHLITDPDELKKYTSEQIKFSRCFFGMGLLNAKGAFEKAQVFL